MDLKNGPSLHKNGNKSDATGKEMGTMANMAFRGTPKQERELRRFIRKHKEQPGALMPSM